jgi:hypothetical protein
MLFSKRLKSKAKWAYIHTICYLLKCQVATISGSLCFSHTKKTFYLKKINYVII